MLNCNGSDWFAFCLGASIVGPIGGALVWHFQPWFVAVGRKFVSWFKGAKYLATKAQSDITALEAKLNAAKAAVAAVSK